MAEKYVREWGGCEDCHLEFVTIDTEQTFTECPMCDSHKVPMPGGIKPIRPKPPSGE